LPLPGTDRHYKHQYCATQIRKNRGIVISYRIVKGEEEDRDNRDHEESHAPLGRHIEGYSVTDDEMLQGRIAMRGNAKTASLHDPTRFSNAGSDT
jgi:hypothetical protein